MGRILVRPPGPGVELPRRTPGDPESIAVFARSLAGKYNKYDALRFNCENLAIYCRSVGQTTHSAFSQASVGVEFVKQKPILGSMVQLLNRGASWFLYGARRALRKKDRICNDSDCCASSPIGLLLAQCVNMNHLRNRQRSTCLIFRIEKLLNVLQTTKNRRAIFTSPHGALETPKKLGIEDASRSVEKRASIVRFAIVHLIADLNVLGPVPTTLVKYV